MHVELRDINDVKPYPNNPRHNDHAVAAVAASIQAFGFRQPLVVDEQGMIVVGDTRFKAARKLGLAVVPVHVAVGLTPAQCKAYRIADNKSAELADWDDDLLVQELADLQKMDFDLDLLGFSADELSHLLDADERPGPDRPRRRARAARRADHAAGRPVAAGRASPAVRRRQPSPRTWTACWTVPPSTW